MLTCHEVTQLASRACDMPLRLKQRLRISLHLPFCKGCRHFKRQIGMLSRWTKNFPNAVSPLPTDIGSSEKS
ncbi:zf-HC2 domain-containing protein [Achromobacter sp. UMC46]|uniref:anti-sigma factor family protein n=1 Tax=Achromobacter sp. UMC46 TaxID=1862319 RepID=UPI001601E725|nr:zf-HC2 domain-containing protein [Achromobacter sp. UMC46]MBB1597511.1 hypothetical protein [Achromobacter sp. UMC46]